MTTSHDSPQIDVDQLHKLLVAHFNTEELDTLCFGLDIEYENFSTKKSQKAREIIEYMARHNRLQELLQTIQKERPRVDWSIAMQSSPHQETELPLEENTRETTSPITEQETVTLDPSQTEEVKETNTNKNTSEQPIDESEVDNDYSIIRMIWESFLDIFKRWISGQFVLTLFPILGFVATLTDLFDLSLCIRLGLLALLSFVVGLVILVRSADRKHYDKYKTWDRMLTFALVLISTCIWIFFMVISGCLFVCVDCPPPTPTPKSTPIPTSTNTAIPTNTPVTTPELPPSCTARIISLFDGNQKLVNKQFDVLPNQNKELRIIVETTDGCQVTITSNSRDFEIDEQTITVINGIADFGATYMAPSRAETYDISFKVEITSANRTRSSSETITAVVE